MITKPMKAATYVEGETKLVFPVEVTDKFDGIRCLVVGGRALSSRFKLIPNDFIRGWIEANCPDGFDGEIMVVGREFNDLSGDVRRKDGEPDFRYHVFDWVTHMGLSAPYIDRVAVLADWSDRRQHDQGKADRVIVELPIAAADEEHLAELEAAALARGREGVMIRSASGPYKNGRSTVNEGYLIKIKRFTDDEATVIGVEEEMENTNPAEEDNFGRTKRSKHKEGLVPKGTMGKLVCRSKAGIEFEIGTGFTAAQRKQFWDERTALVGRQVTFKHQVHGAKERPRCPVFMRFREEWDL